MTIDELAMREEKNQNKIKEHNNWLHKKDWFICVDTSKLYRDKHLIGSFIYVRLYELGDILLENEHTAFDLRNAIYKTNKWYEDLGELDY